MTVPEIGATVTRMRLWLNILEVVARPVSGHFGVLIIEMKALESYVMETHLLACRII
ncbi:MAG: hypothetical protein P8X49_06805 [Syntrophobacterales bacterium]